MEGKIPNKNQGEQSDSDDEKDNIIDIGSSSGSDDGDINRLKDDSDFDDEDGQIQRIPISEETKQQNQIVKKEVVDPPSL